MKPSAWLGCLVFCVAGCAALPRPQIVADAARVAETPAAKEASLLAPQAHAHALELSKRADDAYLAGDLAGSQILGEHAIAAMERAFVLTRLVKAQKRLDAASSKLSAGQAKLAKLDEQAERITAEADHLELRVKVVRDAEPLAGNTPAPAEREQARKAAARALLSQARLLCLATHLLEPKRPGLPELTAKLGTLETQLATATSTDLTQATKARSDCLRELTLVRRPQALKAPAQGVTDALLEQLTKAEKFFAFRDDRGVIVVLRELGKGTDFSSSTREQLGALGRVAKAHPDFPVLVVAHGAVDRTQNDALVSQLRAAGAPRVEGHVAGSNEPVADPKRPSADNRNTRVEVVFVSPAP